MTLVILAQCSRMTISSELYNRFMSKHQVLLPRQDDRHLSVGLILNVLILQSDPDRVAVPHKSFSDRQLPTKKDITLCVA